MSTPSTGRRAFIVSPFGTKEDSSGRKINFETSITKLIQPALQATGFGGGTTGEILDAGNIRDDMFLSLLNADLVICDITIHNANVFYELGIRHALRKKRTLLIKGDASKDETPFDVKTDRYLSYSMKNPAATLPKLVKSIEATMASERPTDSPVFTFLSNLPEPPRMLEIPGNFREQVERAAANGKKEELRRLGKEVLAEQFSWGGLQLVAKAQWDIKDYEAAKENWEIIRGTYPQDIPANEALTNIYERLYRQFRKKQFLQRSDQAIKRLLKLGNITQEQRVEALTLLGRNEKTRWREQFEHLPTLKERQAKATNARMRHAYQAYRDAFYQDLNHFYSGLAALQMVTIFLFLSAQGEEWLELFEDDVAARTYRKELERQVDNLQAIVPQSVEGALRRLTPEDDTYIWALTSKPDLLFLKEKRITRVVKAYESAVPADKPFVWDAVKGQLELFAGLGYKPDMVAAIIQAIEGE